jgi:adenylate cyclase
MDFIAKNSDYLALTQLLARHIRRLHVILDAARLLNSTLDVYELTTIIVDIIRNEVPVDRVSVFVVDQKQNRVRSLVAQGVQGEITLPIGIGIAGFVAETRETLDVTDAYQDARFNPEFDRILGYRTNDILALPVFNGVGVVVGVLELLNRNKPISEEDHEFLRGVCVFIGLALEKAWYCRELEAGNRSGRTPEAGASNPRQ